MKSEHVICKISGGIPFCGLCRFKDIKLFIKRATALRFMLCQIRDCVVMIGSIEKLSRLFIFVDFFIFYLLLVTRI